MIVEIVNVKKDVANHECCGMNESFLRWEVCLTMAVDRDLHSLFEEGESGEKFVKLQCEFHSLVKVTRIMSTWFLA